MELAITLLRLMRSLVFLIISNTFLFPWHLVNQLMPPFPSFFFNFFQALPSFYSFCLTHDMSNKLSLSFFPLIILVIFPYETFSVDLFLCRAVQGIYCTSHRYLRHRLHQQVQVPVGMPGCRDACLWLQTHRNHIFVASNFMIICLLIVQVWRRNKWYIETLIERTTWAGGLTVKTDRPS